jgi:hypothetical protein
MQRDSILVPGSTFWCGGDPIKLEGEEYLCLDRMEVEVNEFRVSRECVSRELYLEFLLSTRRKVPLSLNRLRHSPRRMQLPILGITHTEARLCAEYYGGRLASEVEWELAFRGPFSLDKPRDIPVKSSSLNLRSNQSIPKGYYGTLGGMCFISEWTSTIIDDGWAIAKGTPFMMKTGSLARRFILRCSHRWAMTGFRIVW